MGKKCNFWCSCQKWTWVLSQVPITRFQCYWNQYATLRPWSQIAKNRKLRRQGFLFWRNLWLSLFVTVQNTTSQIDIQITWGYTPKYRKHVHVHIGQFQEGFLATSSMDIITDIHTHKHIYHWKKHQHGRKNATFHIHVKSEPPNLYLHAEMLWHYLMILWIFFFNFNVAIHTLWSGMKICIYTQLPPKYSLQL